MEFLIMAAILVLQVTAAVNSDSDGSCWAG